MRVCQPLKAKGYFIIETKIKGQFSSLIIGLESEILCKINI